MKNKPDLLIVGLGNPGSKYLETRHNAGFRVIDRLSVLTGLILKRPFLGKYYSAGGQWNGRRIVLVKPLTYMNRSGKVVPTLLRKTGISTERLVVVCDTLDLDPGMCRLKRKGGSAGHKGVASIIDEVGTGAFFRMYIGIGRPEHTSEVVDFVLGSPDDEDRKRIEAAEQRAAENILRLCTEPPERVMHGLNRRKDSESGRSVSS